MFGLIYMMTNAITYTVGGIRNSINDFQARKRGKKRTDFDLNLGSTYYDSHGIRRDIATNQPVKEIIYNNRDVKNGLICYQKGCLDGDLVLIDNNKVVIRNISEIERERYVSRQLYNNKSVVDLNINYNIGFHKYLDGKKGNRYKDKITNEIYLCRDFFIRETDQNHKSVTCRYYMSEKTGLLVREADSQKNWEDYLRKEGLSDAIPTQEEKLLYLNSFNGLQKQGGWAKIMFETWKQRGYKTLEMRCFKFNEIEEDSNRNPKYNYFCGDNNCNDEVCL